MGRFVRYVGCVRYVSGYVGMPARLEWKIGRHCCQGKKVNKYSKRNDFSEVSAFSFVSLIFEFDWFGFFVFFECGNRHVEWLGLAPQRNE